MKAQLEKSARADRVLILQTTCENISSNVLWVLTVYADPTAKYLFKYLSDSSKVIIKVYTTSVSKIAKKHIGKTNMFNIRPVCEAYC